MSCVKRLTHVRSEDIKLCMSLKLVLFHHPQTDSEKTCQLSETNDVTITIYVSEIEYVVISCRASLFTRHASVSLMSQYSVTHNNK